MVFIYKEGKFNENSYLVDGNLFGAPRSLSLFVVENNRTRLLIDTSSGDMAELIINKLKQFKIYPIHKILLTHSHWDHTAGVNKLKALMKNTDIEVLASENAIENLRTPAIMNDVFEASVEPLDDVIPLKEGEGLMVKADIKHKHTSDEKLWMLVISKWPHEHIYYDQ